MYIYTSIFGPRFARPSILLGHGRHYTYNEKDKGTPIIKITGKYKKREKKTPKQ